MNDTNETESTDKIISRREVARMLGASVKSVGNWKKKGMLQPVRLPLRKSIAGYRLSDIQKIIKDAGYQG